MTDFQQNQFPFSASVAANGNEPVLFLENFIAGNGRNWSIVPGVTPELPGLQMPSSRWSAWNAGAPVSPPGGLAYVDTVRHAGGIVASVPTAPATYSWVGLTARTSPAWTLETDAFRARLFTRVGALIQPNIAHALGASAQPYAGVIISIAELAGVSDGAFISLGIRLGAGSGFQAQVSKWSDHATLLDYWQFDLGGAASSAYLRADLEIDPEDGLTLNASVSMDGFGWYRFGEEMLIEGECTDLGLGYGCTGYNAGGDQWTNSAVCEFIRCFGPYPDSGQDTFESGLATTGGRNWP